MPEVLTKHPDVVIQVLESAGAKCGDGLPQKILTRCPKPSFCALPGGETCVYGVDQVSEMTQIESSELAARVCKQSGGCAMGDALPQMDVFVLGALSALGLLTALSRIRARRR